MRLSSFFFGRQEIRSSTSSMTSVPKPLKFLRAHYGTLKAHYENMAESDLKVNCQIGCCPLISLIKARALTCFLFCRNTWQIYSQSWRSPCLLRENGYAYMLDVFNVFHLIFWWLAWFLCRGVLSLHLCACHPYISPMIPINVFCLSFSKRKCLFCLSHIFLLLIILDAWLWMFISAHVNLKLLEFRHVYLFFTWWLSGKLKIQIVGFRGWYWFMGTWVRKVRSSHWEHSSYLTR